MPRSRNGYVNGLLPEHDQFLREMAYKQHCSVAEIKRNILTEWISTRTDPFPHSPPPFEMQDLEEPSEDEMARFCIGNFDQLDDWERQFIEDNTYKDRWIGEGEKRHLKLLKAYLRIKRHMQRERA